MRHHWYKPGFWLWWWREQVPAGAKAALGLVALLALGVAGYLSAGKLSDSEQVVFTERVVTVTRTTLVKGKPRVVREVRTTRLPTETQMVTVRRNGKTVVVRQPPETITSVTTVKGPVRTRIRNHTVVQTRTVARDRLRTVTQPGVTLPGTTVTGPERVVTGPERVVTLPPDTVVHTVTQPAQTVTGPTTTVTGPTQTVTQTVTGPTVTETVTVTVTVPPTP